MNSVQLRSLMVAGLATLAAPAIAEGPLAYAHDDATYPPEVQVKVKSVDTSKNALTLSDGKQLNLDPSLAVTKDGKPATIADIKEGDEVRASYAPSSTTKVQQLTVSSSSAK